MTKMKKWLAILICTVILTLLLSACTQPTGASSTPPSTDNASGYFFQPAANFPSTEYLMTGMWEVGWKNLYYNGKPASPIPVSGLMQLHTKTEADYTYLNEFLYTAGDHRIFHVGKPDEAPELVAYLPPSEHAYQWIWVVDPEREIGARNICAVLTVSGQIYELDYNATDKTCEVRPWFQLPCEVEDYISGQIGGGVLRMQAHTSESRELLDGFTIPARAEQEKEEYLKFLKQVYVATDVLNYTIQTGETVHENEEAKAQYAEQFEIL